jgi:nucleoid-associated protein YgaU
MAGVMQQQPTANDVTGMDNVNSEKKQNPSIDWLAETPEKRKEEPKRANKPNKEIERKNRELIEKSKKNEETKKTTDSPAKEKVIPARVRLAQGKTLMEVALEHYGDKVFWVYIYEYNKNIIKHYDHIPLGTELRLPPPKTYDIDPNSQSSVEKAYKKQSELYKRESWDDYVQ